MRDITKLSEPKALTAYRAQPDAQYDGPEFTPVKVEIRKGLLQEQGHLCAYCMQRIKAEKMKVEHWQSQKEYPLRQLDYSNLLGCCMGGEGKPRNQQTCDTRKGDLALKYNPAQRAHAIQSKVRYKGDGRIDSTDTDFNQQIDSVLNLNHKRLVSNREEVLEGVRQELARKPGRRSKSEILKLLEQVKKPGSDNQLKPFVGLLIDYLNKRLKKAE